MQGAPESDSGACDRRTLTEPGRVCLRQVCRPGSINGHRSEALSRTRPTDRDLHGALSVVAEAAAPGDGGPFALPLLERLSELIGADHALAYIEYDLALHAWGPASVEHPVVVYPPVDASSCRFNPLHEGSVGDSEEPLTLSDFLTVRSRVRNPFFQEVLRPAGIEHELKVFLPAAPGTTYEFDFTRGPRSDFGDRERALLVLLRPHLARLRDRWEQSIDADILTPREREIIRHVAAGLTNREIAGQLVVSTNTVRSHLDHIYEKLGVHTRTAAVAAATPDKRSLSNGRARTSSG